VSVSSIGQIISRQNVEDAYIATLRTWLQTYLSEVQAQNSLPSLPAPPSAASFYGGVDERTWSEDELPAVVVIAKPVDDPIRFGSGNYAQWYEVIVNAVTVAETEDDSRALAGWYAAAIATLITQQSDLGEFALDTIPIDPGHAEFLDDESHGRRFAQCPATFKTLVFSTMSADNAPVLPDWPPPATPTVETTTGTIDAVPVTNAP
jgi:hypothetical protein